MIDPDDIPQFTGNLEELESAAAGLKGDGGDITKTGADIHSTFQGLSAFYDAPEAEQLFATTKPVAETARSFGDDLGQVSKALSDYASEVRPIAEKLNQLKAEATTFRDSVKDDSGWKYDGDKVAKNNDLLHQVDVAVAAFEAAERRAANRIDALYAGGTRYVLNDGSNKPDMYGYTADQLDHAKLPWGSSEEQSHHWYDIGHWLKASVWDGLIIDGAWGTLKGLGGLVGVEGWDTFKASWSGLGNVVGGLGLYLASPYDALMGAVFGDVPDSPAEAREKAAFRDFGKGLVAWDEWSQNPGRAAGAVTFNVLTLAVGPLAKIGAAGKVGEAGKLGTVAESAGVLSRAGQIIDPMTYVAKGIGKLPKISDVAAALGNLRTTDLRGLADLTKVHGADLPDGSLRLPDGSILHSDGRLVLPNGDVSLVGPKEPSVASVPHDVPAEKELIGAHAGGDAHGPADTTARSGAHDVRRAAGGGQGVSDTKPIDRHAPVQTGSDSAGGGGHDGTSAGHQELGSAGSHDIPPQHGGPRDSSGSGGHQDGSGTPSGPREVVRRQIERANTDPEWFKKHYKADGRRHDINGLDEQGNPLPQLMLDKAGPHSPKWIAAHDAPPPVPPKYVQPDPYPDPGHRSTVAPENIHHLDGAAERRDTAISADKAAEQHLADSKHAHETAPTPETQHAYEQADLAHKPAHTEMGRAGEDLGDKAAEYHAIPDHFPDARRIDNRETGNHRFDQIWERPNGTYIVVEAKAPSAALGSRFGMTGRPVMQGTREYFETILLKMQRRYTTNPDEAALARKLRRALRKGELRYVVVKAQVKDGRYDGYVMKQFDIS